MIRGIAPGSDRRSESGKGGVDFHPGLKSAPSVPAEAVRAELERVLASEIFAAAERLSRFLRFIVEQSISGRADALKEWLLGVQVFGRSQSFDPRLDAIVRVEAGRLRTKLAHYYDTEGHRDPVVIQVHKGSYAPVFQERRRVVSTGALGNEPTNDERNDDAASIVVLPFVNLSADPENEYFSDGLTEEVITGLTRIPGLRVIDRATAFSYKGQAQDIRRIGAELNVSAALEGSVRRTGDRLRITAQLIDTGDCFHLWSHAYDRQMCDVFAIQQELAEAIGGMVRDRIRSAPPRQHTGEGEDAHDLYVRAMYFEGKRTEEGLTKGLEQLQQAAGLDSRSAPVFARLANFYSLQAIYGLEAPEVAMKKAGDAACRALEIDRTLAQAHAARGLVTALYDWDWSRAGVEFRRALELNPAVPEIHHRYAVFYLAPLGRTEEARRHIQHAKRLDPLSLILQAAECAVLVWGNQGEAAVDKGRKAIELEPTYFLGHLYLSWAYLRQGMATESVRAAEEAVRLSADSPPALAALGVAYASAGRMDKARGMLERLRQQRPYLPTAYISTVYASMGEIDSAVEWLARAVRERSPALFSLRIGLWDQRLRSDSRFEGLARKVGLSDTIDAESASSEGR